MFLWNAYIEECLFMFLLLIFLLFQIYLQFDSWFCTVQTGTSTGEVHKAPKVYICCSISPWKGDWRNFRKFCVSFNLFTVYLVTYFASNGCYVVFRHILSKLRRLHLPLKNYKQMHRDPGSNLLAAAETAKIRKDYPSWKRSALNWILRTMWSSTRI